MTDSGDPQLDSHDDEVAPISLATFAALFYVPSVLFAILIGQPIPAAFGGGLVPMGVAVLAMWFSRSNGAKQPFHIGLAALLATMILMWVGSG